MSKPVQVFEVAREACYKWVNKYSSNLDLFDSLDTPKKFGKYLRKGYSLSLLPNMYKIISYMQTKAKYNRRGLKAAEIPCIVVVKDHDGSVWGVWDNTDLAW